MFKTYFLLSAFWVFIMLLFSVWLYTISSSTVTMQLESNVSRWISRCNILDFNVVWVEKNWPEENILLRQCVFLANRIYLHLRDYFHWMWILWLLIYTKEHRLIWLAWCGRWSDKDKDSRPSPVFLACKESNKLCCILTATLLS